jgi:hypothetical protein
MVGVDAPEDGRGRANVLGGADGGAPLMKTLSHVMKSFFVILSSSSPVDGKERLHESTFILVGRNGRSWRLNSLAFRGWKNDEKPPAS